jgi:hypothetical protein
MALGAAAGGAEALMEIIQQKLRERAQAAQEQQFAKKLAEEARQSDQRNVIDQGQLGLGRDRLGLETQKFGEDTRQFDVSAGQRDRTIKLDEQMQPVRIANIGAQTAEIQRKPQAEQQDRDFNTGRDKTRHGYEMQQIGAQGANALKIANVRHPDSGAAAQTAQAQREQNEVEDGIALIQQIRNDKARPIATGPIQGRGFGAVQDIEGYTRVKALHDNLVNKLQLAQAGKLKGQGQISNMEREMLSKAASALQRQLGDDDYLNELAKVETQFQRMRGGGKVSTQGAGNISAAQEYDYVNGKLVPRKQ